MYLLLLTALLKELDSANAKVEKAEELQLASAGAAAVPGGDGSVQAVPMSIDQQLSIAAAANGSGGLKGRMSTKAAARLSRLSYAGSASATL